MDNGFFKIYIPYTKELFGNCEIVYEEKIINVNYIREIKLWEKESPYGTNYKITFIDEHEEFIYQEDYERLCGWLEV